MRRYRSILPRFLNFLTVLLAVTGYACAAHAQGFDAQNYDWTRSEKFYSEYLQAEIHYVPTVFSPSQAENQVLNFMSVHPELFEGKAVLDIGTGSGIIGLYAAKLGATKVVGTDINPDAIISARHNADILGLNSVFETRLVLPDDMSAYSVIGKNEKFDTVISNPPYSLDIDIPKNTAAKDNGDLGFSIVQGLKDHLTPDGAAVLRYNSYFFHHVIAKYLRVSGYEVQQFSPNFLIGLETEKMFNYYLARILERENLPPDLFRFHWKKDDLRFVWNPDKEPAEVVKEKANMAQETTTKEYPGLILVGKIDLN